MCSGSEEGSHSRLTDFVYHSTLGVRVIKKKIKGPPQSPEVFQSRMTLLCIEPSVQGYLAHKKLPPPRVVIGPYAEAYCRFLGTVGFL